MLHVSYIVWQSKCKTKLTCYGIYTQQTHKISYMCRHFLHALFSSHYSYAVLSKWSNVWGTVTDLDELFNFKLKHRPLLITRCTHTTLTGLHPHLGFKVASGRSTFNYSPQWAHKNLHYFNNSWVVSLVIYLNFNTYASVWLCCVHQITSKPLP